MLGVGREQLLMDPDVVGLDVLLEERHDAWTYKETNQSVGSVSLSAAKGLWSQDNRQVRIHIKDMVGVNLEGDGTVVRFVGYSYPSYGWLWSLVSRTKAIQRNVVTLQATGKMSLEENKALAKQWYQSTLRLIGKTEEDLKKPLLVLVNPVSGPGKAMSLWDKIASHVICKDAGHAVKVIVTERANHGSDYLRDHTDLCASFKGIIVASGDGGVYDALQGIMARKDWAKCLQNLPLGILPCGSGNGLAKSVAVDSSLELSVVSSAVVIARGMTQPLDICAVDIESVEGETTSFRRLYSFLSFEWGLVADADIGSEHLRWMGESRFTVQAIIRLLFRRNYHGKVSYLPCQEAMAPQRTAKCVSSPPTYWDIHGNKPTGDQPLTALLPPLDREPPSSWETVEGDFWQMWNCNAPYMTSSDIIAPDTKLGDGFIQLQWIQKNTMSRWQQLLYLLGLEKGSQVTNDLVTMAPTRAYRVEPLPNKDPVPGSFAVDGELVNYAKIQMENLRGIWKVYSSRN